MRLNRLDLVRYGKFTGRTLEFGPADNGKPDFHIVYGPNEAGKSTLFSAFLDFLFGIERLSPYGFLHGYQTMRIGGVLETGGKTHELYRIKRNQNTLIDRDDQPLPDGLLSQALGSVDRATYQMMFSLDDDSIEKGGDSILKSEGELGALLFSASSGLPDGSATLSALKAKADEFYRPQTRKHRLAELKSTLDALKAQRADIDINAREFANLRKANEQAHARHETALRNRGEIRVALDGVRARIEGLPLLARLRSLRSELASGEVLPEPPADWYDLVPALMREDAESGVRLRHVDTDLQNLSDEIEAIDLDETILALAPDIADLQRSDQEARYRTGARDMPARVEELERLRLDLDARLARLGQAGFPDPAGLLLPAVTAATLHDLAQQHSGLAERLARAREELDFANQAVRQTENPAESENDPILSDPDLLLEKLRRIRDDDCLLRQKAALRDIDQLQGQLGEGLSALAPFYGDVEALQALSVPVEGDVADWKTRRLAALEQCTRIDARIADENSLQAAAQARYQALLREAEGADDETALALRQDRERAWEAHRARLDDETANAFETVLQQEDDLTRLRLVQSDRIAEIRGLSHALTERQAKIDVLRAQRQEASTALLAVDAAIAASAKACGLGEAISLPRFEAWLSQRVHVLEIAARLAAARRDHAFAQADEARALEKLALALPPATAADLPAGLDDALLFCERLAMRARDDIQSRAAVAEQRRRAMSAFEERSRTFFAAEAAFGVWAQSWSKSLEGTWLGDLDSGARLGEGEASTPARILPLLAILQDIDKLIQRIADLDHRVDGMKRDQAAFQSAVDALAQRIGMEGSGEPLTVFQSLGERLRAAQTRKSLFDRLAADQTSRLTERAALLAEAERHAARRDAMLDFFGLDQLNDLPAALEAVRAQGRLRLRISETENDLCRHLSANTVEDAEYLLSAVDREELQRESVSLETRLQESDAEVASLYAERVDADRKLASVSGDDAVARLDEERRTVLADMEEQARQYLRLRTGILASEMALRLYRERHRSAMMRRASDAFAKISGGDYAGLSSQAEKGEEFLIANAAAGGSKLARDLSKGTRFQLYLALRIAGYHEIAANRETLPFVADDIMETFDDSRSEHAFSLMADMALAGQVIYLTHHQHLCDIAARACPGVTIHSL